MPAWPGQSTTKAFAAVGAAAVVALATVSLWLHSQRRSKSKKTSKHSSGPSLQEELREALAKEISEALSVEEQFHAATAWVTSNGSGLSNDAKLKFYGCFKQASAGDCSGSQPWGIEASMKWQAWNALKGSSKDFAMQRYVAILDELAPGWRLGETCPDEDESDDASKPRDGISMGPSVSLMGCIGDAQQAGQVDETPVGQLCAMIAEGDMEEAVNLIQKNPRLACQADKDQMTPLHWAADRGELEMVQYLLAQAGVQSHVNAQDSSGETALHYAILTENEEIAQLLVSHGADTSISNESNETPLQLAKDAGISIGVGA